MNPDPDLTGSESGSGSGLFSEVGSGSGPNRSGSATLPVPMLIHENNRLEPFLKGTCSHDRGVDLLGGNVRGCYLGEKMEME
jgi:hypothetical protein